jgi:uncharacterized protein YycO
MAQPITKKEIESLPVLSYENDLRSQLQSGDLFFTSGNYMISRAIQKVTDSPWSHVGIIFKLDDIDRVLLLESVESKGVRFAPLSKYLSDYKKKKPYRGQMVLAKCSAATQEVIAEIAKSGIDRLTKPYDQDEIGKILARVTLGIGKYKRDDEYICSELVHECYQKAGVELNKDRRGFVSPQNIWDDERVSLLGRIH